VFEIFAHPETYISLFTLVAMEIVLGIDNIIFISILAGKLTPEKRQNARTIGLLMAVLSRLILLFSLTWLTKLTQPLLNIVPLSLALSGKDLVLLAGGLFLIAKSSHEIYDKVEAYPSSEHLVHATEDIRAPKADMKSIIIQIMIIDTVFSLDSIITAVGMVPHLIIMVLAILISLVVMILAAKPVGEFIDKHPSVKILALSFLILIGTMLVAEAFHIHMPKGYIYFALVYALIIEFINMRFRGKKASKNSLESK
jgi:predicted tellurium resistance membrane protein TerC